MSNTREHAGYVVFYPQRHGVCTGTPAFLTRGQDGHWTPCFSLDTAHKFKTDREAREALDGVPDPIENYLHGRVVRVYRETRLVLGGESMEDLNELLRRIRDARPPHPCSSRGPVPSFKAVLGSAFGRLMGYGDAVGVDVPPDKEVRGKVT